MATKPEIVERSIWLIEQDTKHLGQISPKDFNEEDIVSLANVIIELSKIISSWGQK